jgi:protein TonB
MSNSIFTLNKFTLLCLTGIFTSQSAWAQSEPNAVGKLDSKGHKIGVWDYYGPTSTGERVIIQRYDHNSNLLVYYRPFPVNTYHAEMSPGNWQYVKPDQPPQFIGGYTALSSYISKLVYPKEALDRQIEGIVVITFRIDTLGHVQSYRFTKRLNAECDEAAMQVVQTIPQAWVPARLGSHAIAVEYDLPFNFRIK